VTVTSRNLLPSFSTPAGQGTTVAAAGPRVTAPPVPLTLADFSVLDAACLADHLGSATGTDTLSDYAHDSWAAFNADLQYAH
jgi:hypothetical protein